MNYHIVNMTYPRICHILGFRPGRVEGARLAVHTAQQRPTPRHIVPEKNDMLKYLIQFVPDEYGVEDLVHQVPGGDLKMKLATVVSSAI